MINFWLVVAALVAIGWYVWPYMQWREWFCDTPPQHPVLTCPPPPPMPAGMAAEERYHAAVSIGKVCPHRVSLHPHGLYYWNDIRWVWIPKP